MIWSSLPVIQKKIKEMGDKAQVLVCSGNHDGNKKNHADEYMSPWIQELRTDNIFVDWDTIEAEDMIFTVIPWWDGDETKKYVSRQLEEAHPTVNGKSWIWVYHSPPDQVKTSWVGKKHIGDRELNDWIDQYAPRMVISGHIHESPFKNEGSWFDKLGNTWVLNAGSHIGDIPAHIIIDTDEKVIVWQSMAGCEEVSWS